MILPFILRDIIEAGGRPYYVGGYVRDYLLGIPSKDLDIEVFGISFTQLANILGNHCGRVDLVGQSFGIIKASVEGQDIDFSLPRRDSKNGIGHKGFDVEVDPTMTIEEAAQRRDFTINAISMAPTTGKLIDPFEGRLHLTQGLLVHTSPSFGEDPLRVLRGMQFSGRFRLDAAPETIELCKSLKGECQYLAKERIWGEWEKWALKSVMPSCGLNFLKACDWHTLWPELSDMDGVIQDPIHHPEGCVYHHTALVCNAAAHIAERDYLSNDDRLILMFAALCHDMGKPCTTVTEEDGRITSKRHAEEGVPLAESFLRSIGAPHWLIKNVKPLVAEHLVHTQKGHTPRSVRRLMVRLDGVSLDLLLKLIEADHSGRPPLPGGLPEQARKLADLAININVTNGRPTQILFGRHLIEAGLFSPGPELGKAIKAAYEAQLDGEFDSVEGGIKWVKENP